MNLRELMKLRKLMLHLSSYSKLLEAFDVTNPYLASQLDFSDLRLWNQAPTNLKVLSDNRWICTDNR
jgi:hypothetical protein